MPLPLCHDRNATRAVPVVADASARSPASPATARIHPGRLSSRLLAVLVLVLPLLLACGRQADPEPVADADAEAAVAADEMLTVRGEIRLPVTAELPPEARIEVTLVTTLLAATPMAVLARQTLDGPTAGTAEFALEVPAVLVEARMIYALSALVRDREGRVLFVSEHGHRVDPATDTAARLPLVSVADSDATDADNAAIHLDYDCDGRAVHAIYASDRITLTFKDTGQSLLLPAAIAASGARYAIDGNEFWNRGTEASLTMAGQRRVTCHEQARWTGPQDAADPG